MTSGDLLRQAQEQRSRAEELDGAAIRLRNVADTVRDLLAGLDEQSLDVWSGPAADDFARRAEEADAQVRAQAVRLADTAGRLAGEADRLRAHALVLEAQAELAEPVPAAVWGAATPLRS